MPHEQDPPRSFLADIFQAGSSLNPKFQIIVDIAFALLMLVLIMMAYLTAGNFHVIALILVAAALWAGVKWFVYELEKSISKEKSG
jgi:hypothetical protein